MRRLWRRERDPAQLDLSFDQQPHDADSLLRVLRSYGLRSLWRCRLTRNRNVMVSFGGGELRVHSGYLGAPPEVFRAIVTFVESRSRSERRAAQQVILSFPIRVPKPPVRRERTHPDDEPIAQELSAWHRRYNMRWFGGRLPDVPIRISRRMKSRLGHYTAATPGGDPAEIAISLNHLKRHGWEEVLHTLLHEMVHQWQDVQGHTIDHGASFRMQAKKVGVEPFARRAVSPRQGRGTFPLSVGRRAARTS
jgi:hypothetical protein